ncbi:MAG: arylamine N-acetyltransferase [Pyrinomonadaceae bacterium]
MNVEAYLSRIGLNRRDIRCDLETLRTLQLQHLLNVPFENLDIHWNVPIVLDTERFYAKIVENKRGGYCYELNGLFNELLKSLGFHTHLVSGRVFMGERGYSPDFDHMGIVVKIGDEEYLADVGFGDFASVPLKLDPSDEQTDREDTFYVRPTEHGEFEIEKLIDGKWTPELLFGRSGHDLTDFGDRNEFQQHSPDSHFKMRKICSILTSAGRKTLTNNKFIVTTKGERTETELASDEKFDEILMQEFGIQRY